VDILAVLRSFEPAGGSVSGVSVYLSDFGQAQQAVEATQGPVGAWGQPRGDTAGEGRHKHASAAGQKQSGAVPKLDGPAAGRKENDPADTEALRRYELSRFRYYYAVVTCDSVATAEHLYAECDGACGEGNENPIPNRALAE
jgi:hypothetical protein